MKKTIIGVLLCGCSMFLAGAEIKIGENASGTELGAAESLKTYCEKLTGEKHVITTKTSGKPLFQIFVDPKLQAEEWSVKSVPGGVELRGGKRGAVYAVYHYLEDVCGIRFLADNAEYVPRLKAMPVDSLNLYGKPAYMIRRISTPIRDDGDFAAKRRLNGLDIKSQYGGGAVVGPPNPCHTFLFYISPAKYYKDHPEWFSLVDGKRLFYGKFDSTKVGQLCLSNKELRREMLAKLKNYIRQGNETAREKNSDSPVIYDVSQNDNQEFCRCDECKKLAAKYGNKESGVMLDFINELADGIKDEFPGIMLSTFAYQYTEDLPTDITARQNVLVVLCDTKGNLSESISHPSNRYFLSLLEGWSRIAKLAVWDYGCAFAFPHNLPVASEYAIPDDTLLLRKYNLGAYYMEMSDIAHPDAREYKYYLLTKFMENPALDFTTESREFADKYYGEAGPLFLKYRELLRDSGKRKKSFIPMDPYGAGMYPHLDFDTVTAAEKLFDQGEKMLAGDEILLKRWNEARIGIDRAALARRQYILQEHIRRGGTFADYPLDNNVILARLKKSQPAYMDRYIKQQAVSPHLKSNWTKTLIAVEKEFDTFSEKIPEKCLKVPEKFADIEPERVFDFTPFQMVIRSPNIVKVDDSEALSGCAIRIFDSREAPKKPNQLPIRGGLFSYEDWKDYATCWISEGMFSESGYQWFNLGSLPSVKSSACLAIPSWALLIPVADALDAKYPDSSFDLWIRAKFTGTGYPFGKKEDNNACLFDRLVLIKDFPLRVPGGNEKAVTVNGSSSYAVCKTGKEQWYFEYKRRFGLKENAPWRDELGPDLDSFWWVHPKYNHICGFNGNLNFKFDLPEDAGSMQLEAEIGNSADSKTRTFAVQYSFDGNTYLTAGEQKFYPNPGHIAKQISLPEHPKTVWVRFLRKIEPGDSSAYGCGALFKKICIRFDS